MKKAHKMLLEYNTAENSLFDKVSTEELVSFRRAEERCSEDRQ